MKITGAKVYTPEHIFKEQDLFVDKEYIVAEEDYCKESPDQCIDAAGLYAVPGLVDIHFHGAAGCDFCDASEEGLRKIAEYEAENGILAICPATMTYSEEVLENIMDVAAAWKNQAGARLVGINMEGPFLGPGKAGAQNRQYLRNPDVEMFERLQKRAGGLIRLVDIAPELEGAMEFIEKCHDKVRISLAHSGADYETAVEAFQKGARQVTHLYNAMQGIGHREPGPVIAALEQNAMVELICDGVHIHPAMVRFTFRVFGADRVILISDSMMACGLADGDYELGGQAVTVKGNKAVLANQPETIAGSVTNLFGCMKMAVQKMGIPLEWAVRAAAENPAEAIGLGKRYGFLMPGYVANILLIDEALHLVKVIHRGKEIKS